MTINKIRPFDVERMRKHMQPVQPPYLLLYDRPLTAEEAEQIKQQIGQAFRKQFNNMRSLLSPSIPPQVERR